MNEIERAFSVPNFVTWLGMRLISCRRGFVRLELPVRPEFIQIAGAVHGGVLATVADCALACALLADVEPGVTCSTIEIKVNYLAAVRAGKMVAEASVIRRGKSIGVSRADIFDGDGTMVATAMGTFKLLTVQPQSTDEG